MKELEEAIQDFGNWLKDNEWRGVSSELIDEFKDRFDNVLRLFATANFWKDVKSCIAGSGWYNIEEEEERVWSFIEHNFPKLLGLKQNNKET